MTTIAFIGLGNMGGPMARNLVKAGHRVIGFDLAQNALDAARIGGVEVAGTAHDAVYGADVILTMLPAGQHVRNLYQGEAGLIRKAAPGTLIIDSSTIDVASARIVAREAQAAGLDMVDAPVSGGVTGAEAGTLTFMVGGSDAAFARARPVLEGTGKTIIHAGDSGTGQAAKICNNMMLGIQMISVAEAFNLADRLGLDRQKLFDISSKASGQCWSLTSYCPVPGPVPNSPANHDYRAGFTAAMMLKDLKLAADAASANGAAAPLGAAAASLYAMFAAHGGSEFDFSAIIRFLRGD